MSGGLRKAQSYAPNKLSATKGLQKAQSYAPRKKSDTTSSGKAQEVPPSAEKQRKEPAETLRRCQTLTADREVRVPRRKPKKVCFGSAMPTGRTELVRQSAPGPGDYDLKVSSSKCFSNFSLQKPRDAPDWLKSAKPDLGPGMYDIKPLLGTGPKHKMSFKRHEPRPNGVPGPGQYNGLEHTIAAAIEREIARYA